MIALLEFPLIPVRASAEGWIVDVLFYALLITCGLVTFGVFAAALYFCIRYRSGSPASRKRGEERSLGLEIGWTSATMLVFVAIFIGAGVVYFRMASPPENAEEIEVVGKQWMWKVQHADGRREINQLHLLVGQPVKLVMTSQDVIHDFAIPAFRTKQDVVPGRYTSQWFTPTRVGAYHIFCAVYCGTDHSGMTGWVYVEEPQEHARWLAEHGGGDTMAIAGGKIFRERGCSGCHSPQASVHAPLLDGLYQKPVALSDGTVVRADEQYIHDSILQPGKQIAAGYQNIMPTFQGQLSEEEVMELIAYIKSLSDPKGTTP